MFSVTALLSITIIYVGILFVVAIFGDRLPKLQNSPLTYTLSIGVFCTSWTYWGLTDHAAHLGYSFLAFHFGTTLAVIFGGIIIKRMITYKNRFKITSLADLLSIRYKRSQAIAGIVTIISLIGTVPYVSLQLEAILYSFTLATSLSNPSLPNDHQTQIGLILVILLSIFTILFGVRKLDPTERHPGMMLALAVECALKLIALCAAGLFIVYGLFDGFNDIFNQASTLAESNPALKIPMQKPDPITWFTYVIIIMSAFYFLPRQFHVTVVENANSDHVNYFQWQYPIYLVLINLFAIPIAMAGLLLGHSADTANTFLLKLPMEAQQVILSASTFLGGFSASSGMIMVSAMGISIMVSNHLILPIIESFPYPAYT